MDLASLLSAVDGVMFDELLVWGVALAAGVVAMVALVNAVEMFIDGEAG